MSRSKRGSNQRPFGRFSGPPRPRIPQIWDNDVSSFATRRSVWSDDASPSYSNGAYQPEGPRFRPFARHNADTFNYRRTPEPQLFKRRPLQSDFARPFSREDRPPRESDRKLSETIDSVKRKLQERRPSDTFPEEDPTEPVRPAEKKRIEHSPKSASDRTTVRPSDGKSDASTKNKTCPTSSPSPRPDLRNRAEAVRKKILRQLFRLNNNDLRMILSQPEASSPKYNIALAALIKDTRKMIARDVRRLSERSLLLHNVSADSDHGERIVQDALLNHLGTVLDTGASVELLSLDPQVIRELSRVLRQDLLDPGNEDASVEHLAQAMHERSDESDDFDGPTVPDEFPPSDRIDIKSEIRPIGRSNRGETNPEGVDQDATQMFTPYIVYDPSPSLPGDRNKIKRDRTQTSPKIESGLKRIRVQDGTTFGSPRFGHVDQRHHGVSLKREDRNYPDETADVGESAVVNTAESVNCKKSPSLFTRRPESTSTDEKETDSSVRPKIRVVELSSLLKKNESHPSVSRPTSQNSKSDLENVSTSNVAQNRTDACKSVSSVRIRSKNDKPDADRSSVSVSSTPQIKLVINESNNADRTHPRPTETSSVTDVPPAQRSIVSSDPDNVNNQCKNNTKNQSTQVRLIPKCNQSTQTHLPSVHSKSKSVQVDVTAHHKNVSCQTNKGSDMDPAEVSQQISTVESPFTEGGSILDVIGKLKKIDVEINKLLQKKFLLYKSIDADLTTAKAEDLKNGHFLQNIDMFKTNKSKYSKRNPKKTENPIRPPKEPQKPTALPQNPVPDDKITLSKKCVESLSNPPKNENVNENLCRMKSKLKQKNPSTPPVENKKSKTKKVLAPSPVEESESSQDTQKSENAPNPKNETSNNKKPNTNRCSSGRIRKSTARSRATAPAPSLVSVLKSLGKPDEQIHILQSCSVRLEKIDVNHLGVGQVPGLTENTTRAHNDETVKRNAERGCETPNNLDLNNVDTFLNNWNDKLFDSFTWTEDGPAKDRRGTEGDEKSSSESKEKCLSKTGETFTKPNSILVIERVDKNILAASMDGNIYCYCGLNGNLIRTIKCSEVAVTSLCVCNSNNVMYAGSLDSNLTCYDYKTGDSVFESVSVGSPIQSMCLMWNTVYIGTRTGFVIQFSTKDSKLIQGSDIKYSDQAILAMRAIKEGPRKVLLVASRSQDVVVKDATTGLLLRTFHGPNTTIYSILFHAGHVFCGTSGQDIQVFDFATGELTGFHTGGKGAVCLQVYRGLLFAGCYDGVVYVFKPGVQNPIANIPGPGKMLLAMSIDHNRIAGGCKDKGLSIWDIPDEVSSEMEP